MYDGFDDSSTYMSGEIAQAFVKHYPENGFECANITKLPLSYQTEFDWLSWGNSWISKYCNWRGELLEHLNLSLVEPSIDCFTSKFIYDTGKPVERYDFEETERLRRDAIDFPCGAHTMIIHNKNAGEMFLSATVQRQGDTKGMRFKASHLCRYILTVDKVKMPEHVYQMFNSTKLPLGEAP
jgi:hypothetical protein